ncbi:tyrosine-protein phosphatase [Parendozoicomonas haliclonae]|uniref:Dual specificity phosphatase, catalytic domain n=1 Tax=Parendozoicomonas haliclonae TaxID=1960125 RepID=A0A1X7AN73_9GAMM|nr:tyrosine-protein phosphatase [Parendozoicomonas haliclonae]SMA49590.1 Dual specificity phosphatase, catalytic domain [Parendozoicomonas haliclonae]
MSHPFDQLPLDTGASFLFTPCPGTKTEDLQNSLQTLKAAGATTVVTALPDEDMQALNVPELGKAVRDAGLDWFHLPIEDDAAPEQPFFAAFETALPRLLKKISAGETIAIHCRGGAGRTGLIAAILMLESGIDIDRVIAKVQAVRPVALTPPAQAAFLKSRYGL